MIKSFECFAPRCNEAAEMAVAATIKDFSDEIRLQLCAKHSETLVPELMEMYHSTRERYVEARRRAEARQELEELETKERWFAYTEEMKPELLSALDEVNYKLVKQILDSLDNAFKDCGTLI